ncbi:MAG: DUF433 domain-containing protein [Fimbriimonadaceae bacterium]
MERATARSSKVNITEALWQDPKRLSGAVCFRDTRIPVSILFDYLERGELGEFLCGYPDVSQDQIHAVLETSEQLVEQRVLAESKG